MPGTAPPLERYLRRIGYRGSRRPTLETLIGLHRAHLLAIPYENLDIHLGRSLGLDRAAIFDKLVTARRGGWCYEMNGLFAWALGALGFEVRLMSGAVGRDRIGDRAEGNHLVLLVFLDRPWIADVGFGDGFLEPLPLVPGEYRQGFLEFGLAEAGGRWLVRNHRHGGAPGFDFTIEPRTIADFAPRCRELQTSPDSGFVQRTVCQRHLPEGIITLRGAALRLVTREGVRDHIVSNGAEYVRVLRRWFDLELPEARPLWDEIWRRHLAWAGTR